MQKGKFWKIMAVYYFSGEISIVCKTYSGLNHYFAVVGQEYVSVKF